MSGGSRLSWKAVLSLVSLQIHPPALMMQKHAWLRLHTSRLKSTKKRNSWKDLKKDGYSNARVLRWMQYFNSEVRGGDVCVSVCVCVWQYFSFIFISFQKNGLLTCNSKSVGLSATLWCCPVSVAFGNARVSWWTPSDSHVERRLDTWCFSSSLKTLHLPFSWESTNSLICL